MSILDKANGRHGWPLSFLSCSIAILLLASSALTQPKAKQLHTLYLSLCCHSHRWDSSIYLVRFPTLGCNPLAAVGEPDNSIPTLVIESLSFE